MNPPEKKYFEDLYRATDIARLLSISKSAAYRLMKHEIPVVRITPCTLRVRESDLAAYIARMVDHH